jgi:hypothetical protein
METPDNIYCDLTVDDEWHNAVPDPAKAAEKFGFEQIRRTEREIDYIKQRLASGRTSRRK